MTSAGAGACRASTSGCSVVTVKATAHPAAHRSLNDIVLTRPVQSTWGAAAGRPRAPSSDRRSAPESPPPVRRATAPARTAASSRCPVRIPPAGLRRCRSCRPHGCAGRACPPAAAAPPEHRGRRGLPPSTTRTPSQWRPLVRVQQDANRAVVVEDHQVHVAVVVEIARRQPPRHVERREGRPGLIRHVGEPAPALVVKQLIALLERVRVAGLHLRWTRAAPRRSPRRDRASRRCRSRRIASRIR